MIKKLALAIAAICLVQGPLAAQHWVSSWASSQQVAEGNNALRPEQLTDVTLRQLMRLTIGVNDLGTFTQHAAQPAEAHADLVRRLVAAYAEMIRRAHERGLFVIGSTINPYGGFELYHPTAVNVADRQAVNAWTRAPRPF
jgi:class 3 adenylate cyclase